MLLGFVSLMLLVNWETRADFENMRSAIRERSSRRDEIYLDDDMEKKTVCNEAFCVQPAPRKYKFALTPVSENSEISEDAEKAPYKDSDLSRSLV